MRIKFTGRVDYDHEEVEELTRRAVAFVGEEKGTEIHVGGTSHTWPSGRAYQDPHGFGKWAKTTRHGIVLRLPRPEVWVPRVGAWYYGHEGTYDRPRSKSVTMHYEAGEEVRRTESLRPWGGQPRRGWPVYELPTWQHDLAHLAAHEARHVHQFANNRKCSEQDAERMSAAALGAFNRGEL